MRRTTFGDQGQGGYASYGTGAKVDPTQVPQAGERSWDNFALGLVLSDDPANLPDGAHPHLLDMEVSLKDELIAAPGVALAETLTHTPHSIFTHSNLAGYSDLVLLAPDAIGVKRGGATNWVPGTFGTEAWAAALYGDILVMTSRKYPKTLARLTSGSLIDMTTTFSAPHGETIAVFAGRIFIGNTFIGGVRAPLGINWNSPQDYNDWLGEGASYEELISDVGLADSVVALKTMNLDFMAVLNRHSVWIARNTKDLYAPAEFSLRVKGAGCVSRDSAVATPVGVVYLSDDGVRLFDGNTSALISQQINPELMPFSTDLKSYKGVYDPDTDRYLLITPSCEWVYEFANRRWFKRSLIAQQILLFPQQGTQPKWGAATGTWGDATGTWGDLVVPEGRVEIYYLKGLQLGKQDSSILTNFGVGFTPVWSSPTVEQGDLLMTYQRAQIKYAGAGMLELFVPTTKMGYRSTGVILLSPTTRRATRAQGINRTGLGMGIQVSYRSVGISISSVTLKALPRGERGKG